MVRTTGGKTKTRRPSRSIKIVNEQGGEVARKRTPTLRQALTEYYKEKLKPVGWRDPVLVGNTLTVTRNATRTFTALEDRS